MFSIEATKPRYCEEASLVRYPLTESPPPTTAVTIEVLGSILWLACPPTDDICYTPQATLKNWICHLSNVLWEAISSGQVLSLYQVLGTKNLQSFISQFVYFFGYSYFKKLYQWRSGMKSIGTKANLIVAAAAAGACTVIVTQVPRHGGSTALAK